MADLTDKTVEIVATLPTAKALMLALHDNRDCSHVTTGRGGIITVQVPLLEGETAEDFIAGAAARVAAITITSAGAELDTEPEQVKVNRGRRQTARRA